MWLDKAAKLANVGSFLLAIYIIVSPQRRQVASVTPFHPLVWVFWAGIVVSACLHFAAARTQAKENSTKDITESGQTQIDKLRMQTDQPTFLPPEMTPEFLSSLSIQHTGVEARRLIQTYLGKWMRLSGNVGNITHLTGEERKLVLTFEHGTF